MIAYLDTHVVALLAQGDVKRISAEARRLLDRADLLISPMVSLELELLHEIGRIKPPARDVQRKVEQEMGARLCDLPFERVANIAADERWTRDPFDRIIVAQAKANKLAYLISSDEHIATHYPRTIW